MDLYSFFAEHDIEYERTDHPPVYTVEEAKRLVPRLPGAKTKNLFLRDKSGNRHVLVVVGQDKNVDLKALSKVLGLSKLGLASPDRLKQHLGIEPGSVSMLAVVNDPDRNVDLVVDRDVWKAKAFQCHPLVNTSTLVMAKAHMERFLEATGHEVQVASVPGRR
ncbi:MAG: prolyl-tRNA synthetase associated domain-containing protein [Candidatus Latescibacteria bacterium]|jgi:Ala-tRNA(Pro) deacylase|nr:prolyl-tRNA synthetase associated domain-containing protein [Candidatus Latescibacterota bacterium]